ncbi:MAG: 30S ribosomal protein S17 [Bacilli bacterium]|nr:30S ribosomal protein S17 [Bacilli bacterium]
MERNHRNSIQGVVTSVKMNKTIIVTVSTERNDSLYGKRVGYSKKYYAHDENNEAVIGDVVTIMATRPISKLKRFRLVSIDQKAAKIQTAAELEANMEKSEGIAAEAPAEEAK